MYKVRFLYCKLIFLEQIFLAQGTIFGWHHLCREKSAFFPSSDWKYDSFDSVFFLLGLLKNFAFKIIQYDNGRNERANEWFYSTLQVTECFRNGIESDWFGDVEQEYEFSILKNIVLINSKTVNVHTSNRINMRMQLSKHTHGRAFFGEW